MLDKIFLIERTYSQDVKDSRGQYNLITHFFFLQGVDGEWLGPLKTKGLNHNISKSYEVSTLFL